MLSLWKDVESGVEVVGLTQPGEIEEMVRLFEEVAQEQGWQPGQALRQRMPRSVYFGVQIAETAPLLIGGLQLTLPEADGQLPCHDFWPAVAQISRSAHVAVLAVEE